MLPIVSFPTSPRIPFFFATQQPKATWFPHTTCYNKWNALVLLLTAALSRPSFASTSSLASLVPPWMLSRPCARTSRTFKSCLKAYISHPSLKGGHPYLQCYLDLLSRF